MKVLVIGSGGREHAICVTLAKSPKVDHIWCAPGHGGAASAPPALRSAAAPRLATCLLPRATPPSQQLLEPRHAHEHSLHAHTLPRPHTRARPVGTTHPLSRTCEHTSRRPRPCGQVHGLNTVKAISN